jgi:nucleoside-diphosphate-sugar epimerase
MKTLDLTGHRNTVPQPHRTALILGATGGIGQALTEAMSRHGWAIRALVRDPAKARTLAPHSGLTWLAGDAMNRADVIRAAEGAAVIVHAVNPPGYRNWGSLVLPMIDNTIAAARAAGGARIVLPGTIYNFNPATTPVIAPDTPQTPESVKGRVRVQMEQRLREAAPDVPALIVRAGDFFGPDVRNSWFAQAMVKPGTPVRRLVHPGKGVGHSWAYLPDLAEAIARLLDRPERLDAFESLPFEGLWDADGTVMTAALARVTGRHLRQFGFPWWLMRALAPFGGFPREAAEISPYWRNPVRLDNSGLVALLGEEPRTPLDTALSRTLKGLGCLPD